MRTHKSFLLAASMVLLALLSPQVAEAASGTVQKIWLEHNVMHGGQKCLAIHVTLEVLGMRGRKVQLAAYLDSPQGTKHVDTNGQYRANDGQVAVYGSSKAPYESTLWNDWVLYLPNDEIHPKVGKHDYFIQVQAKDGSTLLAESEYVSFSMTGSDVCTNCKGSCRVGCRMCNGTGLFYTGITWMQCTLCGGKGTTFCALCGGTGKRKATPSYVGGGSGGGVYSGSSGVYSGSSGSYSSGSSSSGSKRKTCTSCGGTGKTVDKIVSRPNYTGSSEKEYCSKCGSYVYPHTHISQSCGVCRGKGYTEF